MLLPKLVTTLQSYTRRQFLADLAAGLVVGVVALPLAIAFAIASGVRPAQGLYTAIVAGFIISALGGSRVQIGGPTGAFVVIVYGIVQQYGPEGLAMATILAGIILIGLGLARLGAAIKFIPHPVIVGFTTGIAVIILSSQVKDLLGLRMGDVPAEFLEKWVAFGRNLDTVNLHAVGVSALTLVMLVLWPRVSRRIPAPLVAIIFVTVIVQLFGWPVETIGTRFGEINMSLPRPRLPQMALADMRELVAPAFTIALLGGVESLLSAMVADGMIGGRHRSNMELVAQGVANIATPIFGGIPATGAIARTATNVKNGGRTPVAGMIHAVTLLVITLFFGRWATWIPLASLGAILLIVAYNMSEWRTFRAELQSPRSDVAVLITTFLLTVLVDLTVAIEVGMVLSAFLFMMRMSAVTNVRFVTKEFTDETENDEYASRAKRQIPRGVEVFEINGPFFFGVAETFKDTLRQVARKPKVLIIRMRHVPAMDATGLHVIKELVRSGRKEGTRVLLSDVHAQPMVALGKSELLEEVGEENIFGNIDDALEAARVLAQTAPTRRGS